MSWKDIVKAPTENRRQIFYLGNRGDSYIADGDMEAIVNDLNLPKTNEDGERIEYEEEVDFSLIPSLKSLGDSKYELEIEFKGELKIWEDDNDATKPVHTFTEKDIEFEISTIEANIGRPFVLDYEFSQYNNGKIYLDVFVKK